MAVGRVLLCVIAPNVHVIEATGLSAWPLFYLPIYARAGCCFMSIAFKALACSHECGKSAASRCRGWLAPHYSLSCRGRSRPCGQHRKEIAEAGGWRVQLTDVCLPAFVTLRLGAKLRPECQARQAYSQSNHGPPGMRGTAGRAALACHELSGWDQPTDSSRPGDGDIGRIWTALGRWPRSSA